MKSHDKIAFGGGCHWCTEAVFQSLKGVLKVEQGFVRSKGSANSFSEAVIVHYDSETIPLLVLSEIHLRTHKSTIDHSMRGKYRSAIYTFTQTQFSKAEAILKKLQGNFNDTIITQVLEFVDFKPSQKQFQDYYNQNPNKPFCQRYIQPKLALLLKEYGEHIKNYTVAPDWGI